jgi:HlyD family secretion protein
VNTRLFRQVSLARLSSPEQLDQILRVTSSRQWIGLSAVAILLVITVIWGVSGIITTTAGGSGVLVRSGGVVNVVSSGSGTVTSLQVHVGDHVKAQQSLGLIAQPLLEEKIKSVRQTIAETEQQGAQAAGLREQTMKLQVLAIDRERDNSTRQIAELQDQQKIIADQVTAEEQLLAKGLVTRQQVQAVKQKLVEDTDQVAALRAQISQLDAQKSAVASSPREGAAATRSQVEGLQREVAELEGELALSSRVVTPYSGEVLELKADPGSMVTAGQPLLSLQPDEQNLELLAYLPASKAKDAKAGMEVQVSPSIVKREEFGYMVGTVEYVSAFPATAAALMRNFENEQLVQTLMLAGPVTETRVRLKASPTTLSGFRWSTSGGPPIQLSSGTLCSVQIVTHRQRPISLLFPYLKDKLGLS